MMPTLGNATQVRNVAILTLLGLTALIASAAVPTAPIIALGILAAWSVAALLTLGEGLPKAFLLSVATLLTGYAVLGKGFAYVGVPPLFIGEAVLGLGLLALFVSLPKLRITPLFILLAGFMALGLIRTIPYVSTYGVNALRDAATWYYGLFALTLATVLQKRHFHLAVELFSRILPFLVIWLTITSFFGRETLPGVPSFPGSSVPLFFVKPGDRAVMLVLTASLMLLGLYVRNLKQGSQAPLVIWTFWFTGAAAVSVMSRGGMLAIALAVMLIFLLRPSRRWIKPILCATLLGILLILFDPKMPSSYGGRAISVSQLTTNVTSVLSNDAPSEGGLADTRDWRQEWWSDIYDYTFQGPYFWQGKGFGINLASDDGYQVSSNRSLRSPHSSHMSVLARMGVPGFALWITLQVTFVTQLLIAQSRAHSMHNMFWANVDVWLLAAWLAMTVNSSFDVYLEGPQGGIWFWAIFGAGIAALRLQAHEDYLPDSAGRSLRGASLS